MLGHLLTVLVLLQPGVLRKRMVMSMVGIVLSDVSSVELQG